MKHRWPRRKSSPSLQYLIYCHKQALRTRSKAPMHSYCSGSSHVIVFLLSTFLSNNKFFRGLFTEILFMPHPIYMLTLLSAALGMGPPHAVGRPFGRCQWLERLNRKWAKHLPEQGRAERVCQLTGLSRTLALIPQHRLLQHRGDKCAWEQCGLQLPYIGWKEVAAKNSWAQLLPTTRADRALPDTERR